MVSTAWAGTGQNKKQGASIGSPTYITGTLARGLTSYVFPGHQQGIASEVEQAGHKSAPSQDDSMTR